MALDTRKDSGQEHRDECEEGRGGPQFGEHVEGPGKGAQPAEDEDDDAETDRPAGDATIGFRHSVEILGADEDVETLQT